MVLGKLRLAIASNRPIMRTSYNLLIGMWDRMTKMFEASQILDRIYLGSARDALHSEHMAQLGITHVVVWMF